MNWSDTDSVGAEWLAGKIENLTDHIERITPVEFNEAHRYLPESVTAIPGPISYDVNPFMREIVDCFDINNDIREVNLKKGAQITYTTVLESGLLYLMAYVKTAPIMYVTADKEMATSRIENNILPMLQHSGFADIIRSSDDGNKRKTGKTANHLQFAGGGFLIPTGAQNPNKMRDRSMMIVLKDEIDAWPLIVGKDGDPDALTDARCQGFWESRKIFRGSTPTIKGISKIETAYLRGDQRQYLVLCRSCNAPQQLRWSSVDTKSGVIGGFLWETEDGILIPESVKYCCQFCGHSHYEHDKEKLFSEREGAHWHPTAQSSERGVRSYHLPALYSPIGMAPWSSLVIKYLKAYDEKTKQVTDIAAYQVFYNNILAEPFDVSDRRVKLAKVMRHRVIDYKIGSIPNDFAVKFSGGTIELIFLCVDVHKTNLAISIVGFTASRCSYVIDYRRIYAKFGDCSNTEDPVWCELTEIIYDKRFMDHEGREYNIACTLIDAGYANDSVTRYCAGFEYAVYPILGRDRPAKNQKIIEFEHFITKSGILCYRILVDHYKDRIESVLDRSWSAQDGEQSTHHFNAPSDITDAQLRELTVEYKRAHVDAKTGIKTYAWYRPPSSKNEFFDLLVYSHAALEIAAYTLCVELWKLPAIDWGRFWDHVSRGGKLALPLTTGHTHTES